MAEKPLLDVLGGKRLQRPPVWFMRQAGRYLSEYRALRARAGSFLDLCYAEEMAAEVTLQPIRRFGFDAAILFSDILVVPHALGQGLAFAEGEGPVLPPLATKEDVVSLRDELDPDKVGRVYATVARVRSQLPPEVTLIGFCGAPWTVATYMVSGGKDRLPAMLMARRDPGLFGHLIDKLVEQSVIYLSGQIAAGAEAVQIFDSWAGELAPDQFERWCVRPIKAIVTTLKQLHPAVPVIAFPRGAGSMLDRFRDLGVAGIGLDTADDPVFARSVLGPDVALQGNLDPIALLAGGAALDGAVDAVLERFSGPHIFNLGHGIRPDTPIAHVEQVLRRLRM